MMARWNCRLVSALLVVFALLVTPAKAWHGPHVHHGGIHHGGFGYHGGWGYNSGISYHNYGFGLNHHSFYRPSYGSYFGSYSSFGFWPSSYYYSSYRSFTPYYSYRISYRPTYYYPTYYVPTYYVPTYTTPVYYNSCVSNGSVAPVTYSVASVGSVSTFGNNYNIGSTTTPSINSYVVRKPATPLLPQYQQSSDSPFNRVSSTSGHFVSTGVNEAKGNAVPSEIMSAADAILAAGGYRQAAQAYAQLAVQYGDSSDLYARRLVAQVADGNYEQAAVIINLVDASGITLDRSNLPSGELKSVIGEKNNSLIASRAEGLAANALQQANDPIPLLTLSKWLSFSGDDQRAELFARRAAQLRSVGN